MKIQTINNLVLVTLDVSVKDFEKVKKLRPGALCFKDDYDNEIFTIMLDTKSDCPCGRIGSFGATCIPLNDKIFFSFVLPLEASKTLEDKKEYIMNHYINTLNYVKMIETQIANVLPIVERETNDLLNNIEVL